MKIKPNRLIAAAVFAPLVVPVLFVLVLAVLADISQLREIFEIIFFATVVSYFGFMIFGFPSFLVLRRIGRATLWFLLVSGVICGAMTMFAFSTLLFGISTWKYITLSSIAEQFLWGAVLGLCVATVFCLIAGITRRSTRARATTARAG